jgi:Mn2+/Fe2+ NRAMP family transporter
MVVVMLVANHTGVMGRHTNTRLLNVLGWLATALMTAAGLAMFFI